MTADKPVSGTISGTNFTNTITFAATTPFIVNNKYQVKVHENKGIIDLANNEMISRPNAILIYPTPQTDTSPPYIKSITSDYIIQTITLHMSEKIDQFDLELNSFNNGGFNKGILIVKNRDTIPALCPRDVNPYPLNSCTTLSIYEFDVSLNEDFKSLTVDLTTTDYEGYSLYVVINKNAIKDLKGNQLVSTDFVYKENDDYVIYICPAL